jgi:beta-glucanase (GH16 family)
VPEGSGSSPAMGLAEPVSEPKPVWADEFNGSAGSAPDPTRWQPEVGGHGWGNEELEYNTSRPQNLATDGEGHLAITALRENYSGEEGTREYTSARLATKELFAIEYGRIEARIKLPAGQGLWPAFWAEGVNHSSVGWPKCGEIDVMESLGEDPYTIYGSIHGPILGETKDYGLTSPLHLSEPVSAAYHDYGVVWSPDKIVFTFDGTPYAERDAESLGPGQEWVFDHPFFLRLDLAVGGVWPGSPDSTTQLPAKMLVDWVRVWH